MTQKDLRQGFSGIGALFVGFVIVVAAAGGFLYYYAYIRTPAPNVTVEIAKPDRVLLGEPFVITVSYENNSENVLKNARLLVMLPAEMSFLDGVSGQRVLEESVGDVGPGSIAQKNVNVVATGGVESVSRVQATLRYGSATNPGVQFETAEHAEILLGQPAIAAHIEAPESVLSGERFEILITYENVSDKPIAQAELKAEYPPVFQFIGSDKAPAEGFYLWKLGTLERGAKGTLAITGEVQGEAGSFFSVKFSLTSDIFGSRYSVHEKEASIGIAESPLSLSLAVNGDGEYVASLGERLRYTVTYRNNSETAFQSVLVKAALSGELYNMATLSTNASFDSLKNTLTWSAANVPELAFVEPGEEHTLSFEVKLKEQFPIRRISDKNYTLMVRGEIQSPTVPSGVAADRTMSFAEKEIKVASRTDLHAKAYFFDSSSGIVNSGPYPPRVNQPTHYTVHWTLINYATDVSGIHVAAFLQSGARVTGIIKSNTETVPVYHSGTGEITWDIASMPATKGITSAPYEAIFQVELTPAINQIGRDVVFLSQTRITGTDSFTNRTFEETEPELSTALPHDTRITVSDRHVRE